MHSTPALSDKGFDGVDDFDAYRQEKFHYLYLCENCVRSFDSVDEIKSCKFCDSAVILLEKRVKESMMKGILEEMNERILSAKETLL
jgi:DNA-directed RNA polymerase subunit RPC12/RpoP